MPRILAPVAVLALIASPALAVNKKVVTHHVHKSPKKAVTKSTTTTATTKKTS